MMKEYVSQNKDKMKILYLKRKTWNKALFQESYKIFETIEILIYVPVFLTASPFSWLLIITMKSDTLKLNTLIQFILEIIIGQIILQGPQCT